MYKSNPLTMSKMEGGYDEEQAAEMTPRNKVSLSATVQARTHFAHCTLECRQRVRVCFFDVEKRGEREEYMVVRDAEQPRLL